MFALVQQALSLEVCICSDRQVCSIYEYVTSVIRKEFMIRHYSSCNNTDS